MRSDSTAPTASPHSAILILAFAAFVIVTSEFLIVGLLPALARDLDISIALAGQLVTLFAFTVMLFGPPLTVLLSHLNRKRLFIAILLVFAAANTLAAVAESFWLLAVARVVPALALPLFWGTASDTTAQLAGPQHSGRAVATVYLGISAALLFGIPLGTLLADAFGWRGAFHALALLSLAMAGLLHLYMPQQANPPRLKVGTQLSLLKDLRFLANLALSVLAFTAMFTAYTYLADTLERIVGVTPSAVGWWLMGFGAIGLLGNWIGGRLVERNPLGATLVFLILLALGMATTAPLSSHQLALLLSLVVWGIAHTALFPICQIRVMQAATRAQALAGTLNVSAANAGIGLGAILGGVSIEQLGLSALGLVAAAVATAAALLALALRFEQRYAPS